jgi:hypothetical protein
LWETSFFFFFAMSHFDWPILPPQKNQKKKVFKPSTLLQIEFALSLDANTIENLVGTHGEHPKIPPLTSPHLTLPCLPLPPLASPKEKNWAS